MGFIADQLCRMTNSRCLSNSASGSCGTRENRDLNTTESGGEGLPTGTKMMSANQKARVRTAKDGRVAMYRWGFELLTDLAHGISWRVGRLSRCMIILQEYNGNPIMDKGYMIDTPLTMPSTDVNHTASPVRQPCTLHHASVLEHGHGHSEFDPFLSVGGNGLRHLL